MTACRQKDACKFVSFSVCMCVLAEAAGWQMVRAESLSPVGPSLSSLSPSLPSAPALGATRPCKAPPEHLLAEHRPTPPSPRLELNLLNFPGIKTSFLILDLYINWRLMLPIKRVRFFMALRADRHFHISTGISFCSLWFLIDLIPDLNFHFHCWAQSWHGLSVV